MSKYVLSRNALGALEDSTLKDIFIKIGAASEMETLKELLEEKQKYLDMNPHDPITDEDVSMIR